MGSEHLSVIRQARRTSEYMLLTTEILKVPFLKLYNYQRVQLQVLLVVSMLRLLGFREA